MKAAFIGDVIPIGFFGKRDPISQMARLFINGKIPHKKFGMTHRERVSIVINNEEFSTTKYIIKL